MDKATLGKVLDLKRTRQEANDLYGKTLSLELSILDGVLEVLKAADLTITELKHRFDSKLNSWDTPLEKGGSQS